jgi:hypothetical protein
MNTMMDRAFHVLRTWLGLADAAEKNLTPGHGWLLPVPVEARSRRHAAEAGRSSSPAPLPDIEG